MSEHEQPPDPMPDDPGKREEVEGLLDEMSVLDFKKAREGASAEAQRIHKELKAGRSPQDILDELGGSEEAARIIGEEAVADLERREADDSDRAATIAHHLEHEAWQQILELKDAGASDTEVVEHFGGFDELERRIGSKAAHSFIQPSQHHHKEEQ